MHFNILNYSSAEFPTMALLPGALNYSSAAFQHTTVWFCQYWNQLIDISAGIVSLLLSCSRDLVWYLVPRKGWDLRCTVPCSTVWCTAVHFSVSCIWAQDEMVYCVGSPDQNQISIGIFRNLLTRRYIATVIAKFRDVAQPFCDKNYILSGSPCMLYGLHLDPASAN